MTKESIRKTIGANIRKARIARNLSTEELAKSLALSPGFIGLIESGRRGATVHNLIRLSGVLDMPINAFLPNDKETADDHALTVLQAQRAKLIGLLSDLDKREMEYVIDVVKKIKDLMLYNRDKK